MWIIRPTDSDSQISFDGRKRSLDVGTAPVRQTDNSFGEGGVWQWELSGLAEARGHVTHVVCASPAIDAIAYVASEAGAVPLTLAYIHTASLDTAATIVLHKQKMYL